MSYYIGLGMQLVGLATVAICFVAGISKGDYGQVELIQLVGGSALFYLGQGVKSKSA